MTDSDYKLLASLTKSEREGLGNTWIGSFPLGDTTPAEIQRITENMPETLRAHGRIVDRQLNTFLKVILPGYILMGLFFWWMGAES